MCTCVYLYDPQIVLDAQSTSERKILKEIIVDNSTDNPYRIKIII